MVDEQKKDQKSGITGESLFRLGSQKKEEPSQAASFNKLNEEIGSLSRRIRMLEDRYGNIRKQAMVTDQNMIEDSKNLQTQLNLLLDDVNSIRRKVKDVFEKLSMFASELENTAKKNDLNTVMKYLEMWEPIDFVTRRDAERIVKEAIEEYKLNKK